VKANDSQRGTSLLEVLIALFLLAVAVVSLAPLFITSADIGAAGGEIGMLNSVANDRMETLRATPFHALGAGGSLTSDVSGYSDTSNPDFTVRWEIVNGGGPTGTRTITVRALIISPIPGQSRSVDLTSLRSR
jgi:Tfp pilus assembly protein PilV